VLVAGPRARVLVDYLLAMQRAYDPHAGAGGAP
jgi:hypothetical protein